MTVVKDIQLDWYQNSATVIETMDGRKFEIGTVTLKTWGDLILGCTYSHHVLPAFSSRDAEESFQAYQRDFRSHGLKLSRLQNKIRNLQKVHPEISEKKLQFDDPELIDLSIDIKLPVPLIATDSFEQVLLERITPYIVLLGSVRILEIIKQEKR